MIDEEYPVRYRCPKCGAEADFKSDNAGWTWKEAFEDAGFLDGDSLDPMIKEMLRPMVDSMKASIKFEEEYAWHLHLNPREESGRTPGGTLVRAVYIDDGSSGIVGHPIYDTD